MAAAKDELSVRISVDGRELGAAPGEMLIAVTDRNGIRIPRFCYHEKLSIAANCRMCLVEVERAPKPLPACATPVMDGMVVRTTSRYALDAQKATMEFLLINHPLDCPICDQGGECELQDQAVGYGRDVSRYTERKRVVKDKDIGPLVSTDMTRCIHCTRCVRFGQEIAGIQELGTIGRGEATRIGTFVERSVDHELSGNIIDLCPVGALNNKPFRFKARAWEMESVAGIGAHDCLGSHTYNHVQRGRKVLRAVPRDAEDINEAWISDRDRFSCEGIDGKDRCTDPMIRDGDEWRVVDWDEALERTVEVLRAHGGDDLGVLVSPSATLEEMHLVERLADGIGCRNLDHRLRRSDLRDQAADPVVPGLGMQAGEVGEQDAVLAIGSNMRREVPLLAHRLGTVGKRGGAVSFINARETEWLFPLTASIAAGQRGLVSAAAGVLKAACAIAGASMPKHLKAFSKAEPDEQQETIARSLCDGERSLVVLGLAAQRHLAYSDLRAIAAALAEVSGARFGELTEGANSAGAALAGVLPHRGPGGDQREAGRDAQAMLADRRPAYLLFNVEPEYDAIDTAVALDAMDAAQAVVVVAPYLSEEMREYASIFLPVGTVFETSGSFVNCAGVRQSFRGAMRPLGSARPAWKVLRVLGNMMELAGFDQDSSEDVLASLDALVADAAMDNAYRGSFAAAAPEATEGLRRAATFPLYATDMLVRRAFPLQLTKDAREAAVHVSPADAERLALQHRGLAAVSDPVGQVTLEVIVNPGVQDGEVWVPQGIVETQGLGGNDAPVEVKPL